MYSGLLPKGLTEEDLSPDDEAEEDDVRYPLQPPGCSAEISTAENPSAHGSRDPQTADMPGISQEMWQKFQDLRKKKNEVKTIRIREKRRKRRRKGAERQEPAGTREHEEEQQKHWNDLQQYFGVNDRFQPPPCSKPPPKLAVKIAEAADCRDFVQRKQEEEASRAAQKRKEQIPWGFEAKKRWETKSNMGFM
ncbi:protein FAM204A isoform X2 [Oryzias melastigma]|uniref:protein FAM204A isoform X2 n=1 Tax=Oryzias melastigma TaxID=30732 RepID=UPI000CF7DE9A|nr:protein FAM204A isoform X2 [Oryzias melastigma]